MVLGTSLGSFAAAAVAGFIGVEDALCLVVRQAMVFEEYCEPGGMTAVLGNPALFAEEFLNGHCELAGVNFSSHFVVSARCNALEEIESVLDQRHVGYQRLPVSFPFHSQWINEARAPFETFMRSIPRKAGQLPLICCDHSAIPSDLTEDYFWNIARRPVRFLETTTQLEEQGPRRYVDVGPAGTLATFLKYGMPATTRSKVHTILTPFGLDLKNMAALLSSIRN
jgi:acyl transferase domain-containing protein